MRARDEGENPPIKPRLSERRILLLLAAHAAFRGLGTGPRWAGMAVLVALALQLTIGVYMVLQAFPLPIAAAHNAGAALLVAATVWLNRSLRPVADVR